MNTLKLKFNSTTKRLTINRDIIVEANVNTFWFASMLADSKEWQRCTIFLTSLFILLICKRATVNSSSSLPTVSTLSLKSSSEPPTAAPISARSRNKFVSSSAIRLRWCADRSRSCWSSEVALVKALWIQRYKLIVSFVSYPCLMALYSRFLIYTYLIKLKKNCVQKPVYWETI